MNNSVIFLFYITENQNTENTSVFYVFEKKEDINNTLEDIF